MTFTIAPSTQRHRLGAGALALVGLLLTGCPAGGGSDLSGTYQAGDQNGTMTIEFKGGHKVHLTMQEAGSPPEDSDGDYLIDGNKVTLQVSGGVPLLLARNGDTLEGSFMGQILHFNKQ